jgi:4-carboxymuconolactone decarboxylase
MERKRYEKGMKLRGHIAGAHNNGATTKEIVEVFVQVAVYCGVPASNTAMRLCVEVFRERGVLRKA